MIGDLLKHESTLLVKLVEQIQNEIDFEILYGKKIEINGKKYITYNCPHMIKHPDFKYVKVKCQLKKIMKVKNEQTQNIN